MKVFRCIRLLRVVVWFLRATGRTRISANLERLLKGSGGSVQDTHTDLKAGAFTTHTHGHVGRAVQVIGPADGMNLQL